MYSDKVEVLRFETEPYRKPTSPNGTPVGKQNGSVHYKYTINNNNNDSLKHVIYKNGYHNTLIETTTETTTTTTVGGTAVPQTGAAVNHQPPSDPVVASVLHTRQTPRPGRLLLENVNDRPRTMDRGTQANAGNAAAAVVAEAPPSTSNDRPDAAADSQQQLYRNANIGITNQKLMTNGGDNSSVDSLNSADSTKRDSEDSVIELAEFHQPMISKDNIDGSINMNNGDGKVPGVGKSNGIVKELSVDDEIERTSCGMECLYFAMQCCECSIM